MPTPFPVFFLVAFELLDDVVGGARRGEKQNTPEILVLLFSRLLSSGIERRVGIGKRRWRLGLALKDFKNELVVETKEDAKLGLLFAEVFLFLPATTEQCFMIDWVLLDATFSMATFRRYTGLTYPNLRRPAEYNAPGLYRAAECHPPVLGQAAKDHTPDMCRAADDHAPELCRAAEDYVPELCGAAEKTTAPTFVRVGSLLTAVFKATFAPASGPQRFSMRAPR